MKTTSFELLFGAVMVVNAYTIGVTADMTELESSSGVYFVLEHVFTFTFTLEITLRVGVDGWPWLLDGANFADASLVFIFGVLPLWILQPLNVKSDIMRAFQIFRILRMVRLVRIVRAVPQFRVLWALIQGLLDSGQTLIWTYVMISTTIFMFGVISVLWIGRADAFRDDDFAMDHFGSLYKAAITLFQTATFDSWTSVARPLMEKSSFVAPFFLGFILVVPLALLNLVTAVIVNNAFQNAEKDDELQARKAYENTMKEISSLKKLFIDIDEDGSGKLDHEEYQRAVSNNDEVKEKFKLLGISEQESEEIWQLLDSGDGELSISQFSEGLQSLQGDAKAKDSFTMVKRVQRLNRKIQDTIDFIESHSTDAEELAAEVEKAHRSMGGVMALLAEFAQHIAACVPAGAAPRSEERLEQFRADICDRIRVPDAPLATPPPLVVS